MPVVEMRRRAQRDEELAAVRVRPGVRHREDAGLAVPRLRMELVGEVVARAAGALPERIAALDHERVDDPVEDRPVVVRAGALPARARVGPLLGALGEPHEVLHGLGRFLVEQLDRELAFARRKMRKQHGPIIPLPSLRRLHRPPVRGQPARRVPRRPRACGREDAGDREGDELLGDDVRAAAREAGR